MNEWRARKVDTVKLLAWRNENNRLWYGFCRRIVSCCLWFYTIITSYNTSICYWLIVIHDWCLSRTIRVGVVGTTFISVQHSGNHCSYVSRVWTSPAQHNFTGNSYQTYYTYFTDRNASQPRNLMNGENRSVCHIAGAVVAVAVA